MAAVLGIFVGLLVGLGSLIAASIGGLVGAVVAPSRGSGYREGQAH